MRRLWLSFAMLATGVRRCWPRRKLAGAALWTQRRDLQVRDDRSLGAGRPAARLHHDGVVDAVRDRGEALQLPDKRGRAKRSRAGGRVAATRSSNGGRRYTFFIRKGFRFSDGTPVTAAELQVRDQPGCEQGSRLARRAVHHGSNAVEHRRREGGQQRPGDRRPRRPGTGQQADHRPRLEPDAEFLSTIAMPFFQATSTKLPLDREVVNVTAHERPAVRRSVRVHQERRQHG